MHTHFKLFGAAACLAIVTGCASVPMGTPEQDAVLKTFAAPPADQAGLYIYRDSFAGQAWKIPVSVDGKIIGETANRVYFHKLISPGKHTIGTVGGFTNGETSLIAVAGKNYYLRQSVNMGVVVGGSSLEVVPEAIGQADLQKCELAASN